MSRFHASIRSRSTCGGSAARIPDRSNAARRSMSSSAMACSMRRSSIEAAPAAVIVKLLDQQTPDVHARARHGRADDQGPRRRARAAARDSRLDRRSRAGEAGDRDGRAGSRRGSAMRLPRRSRRCRSRRSVRRSGRFPTISRSAWSRPRIAARSMRSRTMHARATLARAHDRVADHGARRDRRDRPITFVFAQCSGQRLQ